MFAGIFSCTPSFSPEINKVYLILSYLILSYLILSYLILSYLILSYYRWIVVVPPRGTWLLEPNSELSTSPAE